MFGSFLFKGIIPDIVQHQHMEYLHLQTKNFKWSRRRKLGPVGFSIPERLTAEVVTILKTFCETLKKKEKTKKPSPQRMMCPCNLPTFWNVLCGGNRDRSKPFSFTLFLTDTVTVNIQLSG
jgi:hypothetical protein